MIRVLVVGDHAVVRTGLVELLGAAGDLEVIGTAQDGDQAIAVCTADPPDVVLMDLSMPGMDGVEATRRILHELPSVQIVVLTSFSKRERIAAAVDAGAIGYLLKDAEPDELVRGVRAAARGQSPLDPRVARAMLTARRAPDPLTAMTDREREVLALVREGLPNKLIARRLGISEKTVKAHLTSVFRRIGADDRTQAALWASRNGL